MTPELLGPGPVFSASTDMNFLFKDQFLIFPVRRPAMLAFEGPGEEIEGAEQDR